MDEEIKKYGLWLANISGLGNLRIYRMLLSCETPKEIYELSEEQLKLLPGISTKLAKQICDSKKNWNPEEKLEEQERSGIGFVCAGMTNFPQKLTTIYQPPFCLYYRGRLPDADTRHGAIVGARMCSDYGKHMAYELGRMLSGYGVPIISGMAMGVDYHGQKGALDHGGVSYGVLGCGVDICYPDSSYGIYCRLPKQGGLISEYAPDTKPVPGLFPMRNRIISALSDFVIVVEAKVRSGSLITADQALEQGKDVYAVPGRSTDALSYGCNRLIQQGAGIILSPEDLCEELELSGQREAGKQKKKIFSLEKEEQLVYSCLDLRPKIMDDLMRESGLDLNRLLHVLDSLQEKCLIRESFQNHYIRNM